MKKIVYIDIDGVLNYYPQCWLDYLNEQIDAKFSSIAEAKDTLLKAQHLTVYDQIKAEYRESSYKHSDNPPQVVQRDVISKRPGFTMTIVLSYIAFGTHYYKGLRNTH